MSPLISDGIPLKHMRGIASLLLMLIVLGYAGPSHAAANCTSSGGSISLANVSVPLGATKGTLLGSPASATVTFYCSGLPVTDSKGSISTADRTATIQAGETLAPLDAMNVPGGYKSGNGIIFSTGVAGIGILVTGSPTKATSYSDATLGDRSREGPDGYAGFPVGSVTAPSNAAAGSYSNSVTEVFTAQFIVTGTVTPGSLGSVGQISLMPFWWYIAGGDQNSASAPISGAALTLNAGSMVSASGCSVGTGTSDFTVTLPTVMARDLASAGMTAGRTPFAVTLNCQSGTTVSLALQATQLAKHGGTTLASVMANTTTGSGAAKNVGLQLRDGTNKVISFNTSTRTVTVSAGSTPNGAFPVPFYVEYYALGAATVGSVQTTATYTITYP